MHPELHPVEQTRKIHLEAHLAFPSDGIKVHLVLLIDRLWTYQQQQQQQQQIKVILQSVFLICFNCEKLSVIEKMNCFLEYKRNNEEKK